MIITKRLVFIHLPKTGGTFVTRMLADLHLRRLGRLRNVSMVRRVAGKLGVGFRDVNKHGGCTELPSRHRHKPLLGCIRNPYAHCVSLYEFGWWRDYPRRWWDWATIRTRYPHFPDISFAEFVDISTSLFHRLPTHLPPDERIGFFTSEFVRYYFRQPIRAMRLLEADDGAIEDWQDAAFPVRLLRTEQLNRDLHAALSDIGYCPSQIAFILDAPRILPPYAKPRPRTWESYYTPELRALVRHRERLLFRYFPEYDA